MNLTSLVCGGIVYFNCENINGYSFTMGGTRDKCAHFDLVKSLSPSTKML